MISRELNSSSMTCSANSAATSAEATLSETLEAARGGVANGANAFPYVSDKDYSEYFISAEC